MLIRPFITFAVLSINIGNAIATNKKDKQSVPQIIDSHNQPPTVPIAAAVNHPSNNVYPSTEQRTSYTSFFRRKKRPEVAQNINAQYSVHPAASQSPHHAHHYAHSPNMQPLQKITPPMDDPHFSEARCGFAYYNKDEIISARAEGCRKMPFYHDNLLSRKAVEYHPADPMKYKGESPLYIYPIGKPFAGVSRTKHYGFDRIVLNKWCQAVGVITERPRVFELVKKTGKFVTGRPLQNYNQKNYEYVDCRLT